MRKYSSNTLYFFPLFLPLAELLPWLLTLLGTVAGVAGFSRSAFWIKYRRVIMGGSIICFCAAAGLVIMAMPARETKDNGTREILQKDLPVVKTYREIGADAQEFLPPMPVQFQKITEVETEKAIITTPVICGSLALFGSYEGTVEAVSLKDGKPVWSLPQKNMISRLSREDDGVIFAQEGFHSTTAAALTAIDPASGRPIWSREFLGHLEEYATFDPEHNRMWISAGPGGIWSVKKSSGKVLWHAKIGHADTKPLFSDDRIYAPAETGDKSSALFALDADDGKILWKIPQQGQPWGSPVMDKTGTKILTTSGFGQIGIANKTDAGWAYAISPVGEVIWQVKLSNMPLQPAAYLAENDLVIHTLKNGEIVALRGSDGSTAWQVRAGDQFQAAAVLINISGEPLVASTSFDGLLTIRSALTGEEFVREIVGTYAISSPVADGDIIYAASAHKITAFGPLSQIRGGNK